MFSNYLSRLLVSMKNRIYKLFICQKNNDGNGETATQVNQ